MLGGLVGLTRLVRVEEMFWVTWVRFSLNLLWMRLVCRPAPRRLDTLWDMPGEWVVPGAGTTAGLVSVEKYQPAIAEEILIHRASSPIHHSPNRKFIQHNLNLNFY